MARRFKFQLASLLSLREREKSARQRETAAAAAEFLKAEARISEVVKSIRDVDQLSREARLGSALDVSAARRHAMFRALMTQQLVESKAEQVRRQEILDAARRTLTQAAQRVKALEKLRERRWMAHMAGVRREEQFMTDEVAGQRFIRDRLLSSIAGALE